MGNAKGTLNDSDTYFFETLSGNEVVNSEHSFWNDAFDILSDRKLLLLQPHNALTVSHLTQPFCKKIVKHNYKTGNMQAFLFHLVSRLRKYSFPSPSEDAIPTTSDVKECANGLYIARIVLLHLSKHCNSKEYAACFCQHDLTWKERKVVKDLSTEKTLKKQNHHSSLIFELLEVLVKITCQHDGDPPHHTMELLRTSNEAKVAIYVLRLEVLHTLLVLFSTRLYYRRKKTSTKTSVVVDQQSTPLEQLLRENTKTIPGGGSWSRTLIPALFTQITSPRVPPTRSIAEAIRVAASDREEEDETKDVSSPSSSIDTVLKMPLHLFYMIFGGESSALSKREEPLSQRCLLLLLTLIHSDVEKNPYDCSLKYNVVFRSLADEDDRTTERDLVRRVSFNKIYGALQHRARMRSPQGVLLMYSLLQHNSRFREYVMSRSDPEAILFPLLEQLHEPAKLDPSQLYLLIILVLIFTQDGMFNDNAHQRVVLSDVPWFVGNILRDVTLGSLMFLVLLHVLQFNMAKLQDPHVHTYCTAALTNMSPHCQRLHANTSEKLVLLFRNVSKKYFLLCENLSKLKKMKEDEEEEEEEEEKEDEEQNENKDKEDEDKEELAQHAEACQELLRMFLDIILLCVSREVIRHNTTLLYVLLHERAVFDLFKSHKVFGSLVTPLVDLLSYLYKELEHLEAPDSWTYESVMKHINELCNVWKGPELPRPVATNEEMKSRYEEAPGSQGFFEPFVWKAIVSNAADIDWEPKIASMFHGHVEDEEDEEEEEEEKEEGLMRSSMEL